MDKKALEKQFEEEVIKAYKEAKKYKFRSHLFEDMISRMGVFQASLNLTKNREFSSGFSTLVYIHNRPDLTVEAVALRGPWKSLFPESALDVARMKLKKVKFPFVEYHEQQGSEETTKWCDEELVASVEAYVEMLEHERAGEEYNKAEFNRRLREDVLKNRTEASVEITMQNISAVLDELGLDWIAGYKPKANVEARNKDKIKEFLLQYDALAKELKNLSEPTPFEDEFNERVKRLSKTKMEKPEGVTAPKKVETTSSAYYRDPRVKVWVLQNADGSCEACGKAAAFITIDGVPYLEVHHVKPLGDGGSDRVENAVALCPNCHKECHFSAARNELIEKIYAGIKRLMRE